MLTIKEPIDSARGYFVNNFYDLAEGAFTDIRGRYWEHRALINQQLDESRASSINLVPAAVSRKQPTISVPKFDGDLSSWISYRDMLSR